MEKLGNILLIIIILAGVLITIDLFSLFLEVSNADQGFTKHLTPGNG